ncbi:MULTISPECIES: hypothetical protein [unclassified Photobacterium]|uniref:hypothetical protein n=1 Tax=unclassified Photobacterium TaxID=2628852 RepID=UPI001B8B8F31|nr:MULTISPECIES: hypothetical protein [unclassified Photobacterium]MDO6705971.1 hypothetical protein [Photobacterium sp. 1_MG-2023]QUJ69241.1 hypothetical protein KDD30_20910 [Photobacterium sp. GJ3]
MSIRERIEDIEQRLTAAYQEGDYQQVRMLENQLKEIRGHQSIVDDREPYSPEGRFYPDDGE